ncbi:chaperone NapD [Vreelandella utahensis]|uniref:chaperone NapD n=1 Tax=Vreelandella halophila TaxID=86177 RepID=UPI000985345B|nr:chaperone NapD [Halomonas utahensis]
MTDEIHIASLLLQVAPQSLDALSQWAEARPDAEVRGTDPAGKLVLITESEGRQPILDLMDACRERPGVFTVNLIYHEILNAHEADQPEEIQP